MFIRKFLAIPQREAPSAIDFGIGAKNLKELSNTKFLKKIKE